MLAVSDWMRGGSFCMAQEIKKHNTPIVVGRMQTTVELEQGITNPWQVFELHMDCIEVVQIPLLPSDTSR